MSRYSDRAKRNMRKQINTQIQKMRSILAGKKKELVKAKSYRKYGLPGQKYMERAMVQGIAHATKDLNMLIRRKNRLAREGKI